MGDVQQRMKRKGVAGSMEGRDRATSVEKEERGGGLKI